MKKEVGKPNTLYHSAEADNSAQPDSDAVLNTCKTYLYRDNLNKFKFLDSVY